MNPIVSAAIISAIAIILGPAIGALISLRKREPKQEPKPEPKLTNVLLTELRPILTTDDADLNGSIWKFFEDSYLEDFVKLQNELTVIRMHLLEAKSNFELQECRFEIEEFLSRHRGDKEGKGLQSQIRQAI